MSVAFVASGFCFASNVASWNARVESTSWSSSLNYVTGLSDPITALAVGPTKLALATVGGTGTLVVYTADAFGGASVQPTKIASGLSALPSLGLGGARFYGLAARGSYVYFAHDAGVSYAPADGSGAAKPLVVSQGVFAITTDAKYLYYAAAKVGTANPSSEGFFRVPLPQ